MLYTFCCKCILILETMAYAGFRIRPAGSTIANIVPYGASATQVAGKSRFALEAEANAETQKHDNVAQVTCNISDIKTKPQLFISLTVEAWYRTP